MEPCESLGKLNLPTNDGDMLTSTVNSDHMDYSSA